MLSPGEGQLSLAGQEEVAREPGDWLVWVETVSPGVLEPQNHRGLTAPLLPGRWRLAFRVGFSSVPLSVWTVLCLCKGTSAVGRR